MRNNRRKFLKNAGAFLGVGISLPLLSTITTSCDKNEGLLKNSNNDFQIFVADYPGLADIGGAAKIKDANFNEGFSVIVIRTSDKDYLTFTSECTHKSCEVDLPKNEEIPCGCHGSVFSAVDGAVIEKPFDGTDIRPLPQLKNSFDEQKGVLTIMV